MHDSHPICSPCAAYSQLVHGYVAAQLANYTTLEQFADLRRHLDQCPRCAKFYMTWYDTMRRTSEDTLPAANALHAHEVALDTLASLSQRPPTPPHTPQMAAFRTTKFPANLRQFFGSSALVYLARRTVYAAVSLTLLTAGLWVLYAQSITQFTSRVYLSESSHSQMKVNTLREHSAAATKAAKQYNEQTGASTSPLPTPRTLDRKSEEEPLVVPKLERFCETVNFPTLSHLNFSCLLQAP